MTKMRRGDEPRYLEEGFETKTAYLVSSWRCLRCLSSELHTSFSVGIFPPGKETWLATPAPMYVV